MRGVAILLVVFGHCIQYGSESTFLESKAFFDDCLFKLIYSFHMPLFALLSGYLFYGSMKKDAPVILKRRVTSLLIPIFCWVTLETLLKGFLELKEVKLNPFLFVKSYTGGLFRSFWFIWAILYCSVAVILVEKLFKGKDWLYLLSLLFLLFFPKVAVYIYIYPYFVAGYLFNKFDGKKRCQRIVKNDRCALMVAVAVFAVLFPFYGEDAYIYTTGISLLGKNEPLVQLGIDIYRWVIGFSGSIMVIILCKIVCDKWRGGGIQLLAYLGRISLGIYILNSYANNCVLRLTKELQPNMFCWIIETIVSVTAYVVAVEIIKKSTVAKKLLLGGR